MNQDKTRNTIQTISLIVGIVLFLFGLMGIFRPTMAGLHLTNFHSAIVALTGTILFYNGYRDNERDSFLACLCFGLYFLFHSIAGFVFGNSVEPELIRIIPNFTQLEIRDHLMNGIIGIVLLGGATDWWRVNHERKRWNRHDRRRERFHRLVH